MTYSSAVDLVRGIKARLAGCGVDMDALFRQAGLDEAECAEDDALTLSDKLSHAWELATQATGDPLLGLKAPSPQQLGWLGLMGHIMLVSPDVKSAIENLVRYTPLVSPTVQSTIEHNAGRTRITLHLPKGQRPVPQQRYDFVWSMVLHTLRCTAGRDDLKPVLLTYAYPRPAVAQAYADAFGCEVLFGMDANSIEFTDTDLAMPLPTAPPMAADWTLRLLAQLAQSQHFGAGSNFSAKVQRILASMLAKGEPLREEVAKRLMVSERTLQRRLAEEGTTFTRLVDDTRRELAQQYLSGGQLSLKKLSFQLGFSEPSAFHRACKRWFGRSPKQLQQVQVASNVIPIIASRPPAPAMPSGPADHPQQLLFFESN